MEREYRKKSHFSGVVRAIEVYIRRLREKLGPDVIETRRGQGYVFGDRR